MFNKEFNKIKSKKFNAKKHKQAISNYYKRKRLLCDKCKLRCLSVEEIELNYEEILKK